MPRLIRFNLNQQKAIEVLVWLSQRMPGLTPGKIAKLLYFADKDHLNRYARPILGDRYIAMEHGPVPSFIYDALKKDKGFLDPDICFEIDEAIGLSDRNPATVCAKREPRESLISKTDFESLRNVLARYGPLSFQELRDLGHKERAWIEAAANQEMDYELMVDESTPDRDDLLEEIREKAMRLVI